MPTILFLSPNLDAVPYCLPEVGDFMLLRDLTLWQCYRSQPSTIPSVKSCWPIPLRGLEWVRERQVEPSEVRRLMLDAALLVSVGGGIGQ
jgi:hypothetical protein